MKLISCIGGDEIAQTLDASYYKGPGARNGKEREIVCVEDGAAVDVRNGTESSEVNGTLQAKEQGYNYTSNNVCRTGSVVRRLTPLECERLQQFPDNWSKYGMMEDGTVRELPDSARYRIQGNSIARPFWTWLLRRIAAQYERPATLGSLFDGQGGFPLCWKEVGGITLWVSEIEKYACAVTRYNFGEEQE